ncbi:MAG TPA: dihydroorotase [Terriglobia bacterium]|nr:dihydroorotase [Terriglobia bacterium]
MASLLIKGGRVLSPADALDGDFDILVEDSGVREIAPSLALPADEVFDARGQTIAPGFIDLHVHLREPGGEASETLATGLAAAVAGGFTAVCPMPNTRPVNDRADSTRALIERAAALGLARVFPIAAVSMGSEGQSLTDFRELVEAGAVAFSDDGRPVKTAGLMRRALEEARTLGVPIIDHCEDASLSGHGAINEGAVAARLGVRGIPASSEDVCVARDLVLAESTGARLHVAHLSTRLSLEMVLAAKGRGLRVTCEVTPHHAILTDEAVAEYGTNAKMNPPLRSARDVEALVAGLADGTVDALATDHAPHASELKQKPLAEAPFGVIGLETALGLALTHLVHTGRLSLAQLVALMSRNPAGLLDPSGQRGLGRLRIGGVADLTVFDPNPEWTYRAAEGRSKSRNSPFDGWKLKGAVTATIVSGKIVYRRSGSAGVSPAR